YVVESGPLLHSMSAERDVVAQQQHRSHGAGLLAIGNPDFDDKHLFSGSSKAKPRSGRSGPVVVASSAGSGTPPDTRTRGLASDCDALGPVRVPPLPAAA